MNRKNNFYNEFDFERMIKPKNEDTYRTPFQIDRDRIIHSSEFRRLQGKTQVFLPGEYDFYRTRLTHSIEVAQIGRSICGYLSKSNPTIFTDDYYIDPDLVESACLSHDLGHPPFGHAGERTLNKIMAEFGGFEGNGQTLRLITEVFWKQEKSRIGMNPSRAFIDSLLKYKSLFTQMIVNYELPENHFIYDYQKEILDFVYDGINLSSYLKPGDEELNSFRSIECQIMDWADDTAYAINDIVDSVTGGFLNLAKLNKWGKENSEKLNNNCQSYLEEINRWIYEGKYKAKFSSRIGNFIEACSIKERETILDDKTNRYKYELIIDDEMKERVEFYKRVAVELVFRSTQLHQMEYKGDLMIRKMFEVYKDNYLGTKLKRDKLVPEFTDRLIREESDKIKRARIICDYIAGMTDGFAIRSYKRLFDPDYSSLVDLV